MQLSDNPLFDGQGIEFHHLQRLDQRKQTQEIQKLLKEQARQRKGVCPCPHCGAGVPQVGVAVCMHCGRDLFWSNGECGATKVQAQKLADKKRLEAEDNRRKYPPYWETAEGKAHQARIAAKEARRQILRRRIASAILLLIIFILILITIS